MKKKHFELRYPNEWIGYFRSYTQDDLNRAIEKGNVLRRIICTDDSEGKDYTVKIQGILVDDELFIEEVTILENVSE